MKTTIITDTINLPNSRLDSYWSANEFKNFYSHFRSSKSTRKKAQTFPSVDITCDVQEKFGFKGFQFGNWTTNEDRFNYLGAFAIACVDLDAVLKFSIKGRSLGFNTLAIAFGARGRGIASAHYEPGLRVINITRYKRPDGQTKLKSFKLSGGVGAFAHEYGHFLDYYFGSLVLGNAPSLSGGRIAFKNFKNTRAEPLRNAMENILERAFVDGKGNESVYIKRLRHFLGVEDPEYWLRRNEVFARTFEQYIQGRLESVGVSNTFLTELKYERLTYPNKKEAEALAPLFTKLINLMRAKLKKTNF